MLELLDVKVADRKASTVAASESEFWSALSSAEDPESFGRSWLTLACRSFEAVVEAALLVGPADRGPFRPVARWSRSPFGRDAETLAEDLGGVLEAAIERRQPAFEGLVEVNSGGGEAWVGYPLLIGDSLHGVVLAEAHNLDRPAAKRLVRHLQWSIGWFEAFVRRRSGLDAAGLQHTAEALIHVIEVTTAEARLVDAARVLAGTLEQRLGCDQAAVSRWVRHRSRLIAVGQAVSVERRSQAASRLAAAADEAIDQGTALVAPPPTDFHYVTAAQEAVSRESGSAHVLTLPIGASGETFGALTLLRRKAAFSQTEIDLVDAIGASVAPILLEKARTDRSLLSLAAAKASAFLGKLLGPRHLPLKLGTFAAIAATVTLTFATDDYRVRARAEVQGEIRRSLSAPFDGYIKSAEVRAGDRVQEGAVLAELRDNDLVLERLRQLARKREYQSELDKALAKRDLAGTNIAKAQVEQAEAEIELSDQMLARAKLTAPFAAVIVSGDLSQSIGRPVSRGDTLFEIAPLDHYRVTLVVPEADVMLTVPGMKGEILLSAIPEHPFPLEIKSITPVARAGEGGNGFEAIGILAELDKRIRPGMEGIAKIPVGERRLVWIWTHSFFDWVRVKIWGLVP